VARIDDSLNHWRQKLLRIDRQLAGTASMQRKALSDLKEIVDPNAVAAIDLILGRHPRLDTARAAMRTLRQIDGYEASQVLAKYAVFSDIPTIRREATEHLSGRRYEDFVPGMISLMATEVQGSLAEIWDGCGKFPPLISEIAVYLKLERETGDQIQVSYTRFRLVPRIVKMISLGLDGRDYRRAGSPTVASIVVDSAFHATRRRVDEVNEESAELNGRVSQVLSSLTGRNRTDAPDYWWKWWNHERDVESGLKPVVEVVEVGEGISIEQPTFWRVSCFAAETPVWTETGLKPIESIRIGDRVLSKNIETSELAFRPVLKTTIRKAKPLVVVRSTDEEIKATGGHQFWQSGQGWVKARDLSAFGRLHTVTGNAVINDVRPGPARPNRPTTWSSKILTRTSSAKRDCSFRIFCSRRRPTWSCQD
jgi:hypothetical protein